MMIVDEACALIDHAAAEMAKQSALVRQLLADRRELFDVLIKVTGVLRVAEQRLERDAGYYAALIACRLPPDGVRLAVETLEDVAYRQDRVP